jgi:colanic acid biosynthesis glycosyl transferase WcaI
LKDGQASVQPSIPNPKSKIQNPKSLVIFSQVFVPDPASVGQHIADVAIELVRRGYKVRVYTADRGYDDPTARYPRRENLQGVDVRRMPFSSFGKKTILTRILGTASFMIQALLRGLFMPDLSGVFFSTSPPLIGIVATIIHIFRQVPIAYWAMDLNPDQLIALNKIKATSPTARLLESTNRIILRNSDLIVALDRFMVARLRHRERIDHKLIIIPPWPHEQAIDSIPHSENPFRAQHNLTDKFVIMYSGNHSPSNPLTTLLDAAVKLKDDPSIQFLFVGGGIGKKEVEQYIAGHQLKNVTSLPYQPLSELGYSLSAADIHVVSLGPGMAGIIHPCKVYGAMAVARPVLYFGPKPSHISDLLDTHGFGQSVEHGQVQSTLDSIQKLKNLSNEQRAAMGQTAHTVLTNTLSQSILNTQFCDALDRVFNKSL